MTTNESPERPPNASAKSPPKSRLPEVPYSVAAEAAVLGSMILDPQVIPEVTEILHGEDFYLRENVILWQTILAIYAETQGRALDGLLVHQKLEADRRLEAIGGSEYLQRILETVPSSANAQYYAGIVREKALRRLLIRTGMELVEAAQGPEDVEALVEAASATVSRLGQKIARQQQAQNMTDLLIEAYGTLERDPVYALPCSVPLAEYVRGFQAGQMIVICGRPAHGKSSFALHLAIEGLRHSREKRVVFFSFEMLPVDMMLRILSAETGISFRDMTKQGLALLPRDRDGQTGYQRILATQRYFADWDLSFVGGNPTPMAVAAQVRRMHQLKPVDCVFIDYIQRMYCTQQYNTRDREVSVISNALKNLALELQIPVVVLAQLNRAVESRDKHTPRLSDLRESGTIEQDSDVVIAVNRPEKFGAEERKGVIEIIVLKHRNGPDGQIEAIFDGPTMTIRAQAENVGMFSE